ncbi:MAG: DMT family transporter [Thermoplasmatota archaeon]
MQTIYTQVGIEEAVKVQNKAYILGLLAVVIWSTVASVFKLTLEHTEPVSMVFIASVVSSGVLFAALAASGKLRKLSALSIRDIWSNIFLGILNPFLYYIVLFSTYDILKAQEAQALNYTWPIMLTLLSMIFLKQRITRVQIAAVLLSFIGVLVITSKGSFFMGTSIAPLGIFLGLLSAAIWASYWTVGVSSKTDPMARLFLNFLSGSVVIGILVLIRGGIQIDGMKGLLGSAYIGIFEMGLTFIIWMGALKLSSDTSKISNLIYLSPFISLVLISILVGEDILLTTVVGLVLIVLGIILQRFDDRRKSTSRAG